MWPFKSPKKKTEVNWTNFKYFDEFYNNLFELIKIEVISQKWYKPLSRREKRKILLSIQFSKRRMEQDIEKESKKKIYPKSLRDLKDKDFGRLISLQSFEDWRSNPNPKLIPQHDQLVIRLTRIRSIIRRERNISKRDRVISKHATTLYTSFAYIVQESIRLYEDIVT